MALYILDIPKVNMIRILKVFRKRNKNVMKEVYLIIVDWVFAHVQLDLLKCL